MGEKKKKKLQLQPLSTCKGRQSTTGGTMVPNEGNAQLAELFAASARAPWRDVPIWF